MSPAVVVSLNTLAGTVTLGFNLKIVTCNAPAAVQPAASFPACVIVCQYAYQLKANCIPWSKYKIKNHTESSRAVV
jgi:hypothetical protein